MGISCGPEETLTKETPITRPSLCSNGDKVLAGSLIYVFQSILTHVLGLAREALTLFSDLTAWILHEVPDEIANMRGGMADLFGLMGQATATTRPYHRPR